MSHTETAHSKEISNGYGGAPVNRAITPGGHPADATQAGFPVYHRKFANPAPLGLMAFAATTFFLSMVNVRARGIEHPNVVVGMALFYGGLAQLLAGMWEFATGNTFGATAFSSYGAFWLSYATIQIPSSGILAAFRPEGQEPLTHQLTSSLSIFLATWFIFTTLMLIAALRSSVGLVALFFFLDITFLLLMCGDLTGKLAVTKAGGSFGILTAFIAWYVGLAGMLTNDNAFFLLPTGEFARRG